MIYRSKSGKLKYTMHQVESFKDSTSLKIEQTVNHSVYVVGWTEVFYFSVNVMCYKNMGRFKATLAVTDRTFNRLKSRERYKLGIFDDWKANQIEDAAEDADLLFKRFLEEFIDVYQNEYKK